LAGGFGLNDLQHPWKAGSFCPIELSSGQEWPVFITTNQPDRIKRLGKGEEVSGFQCERKKL